ncbi:hypothetical protein HAZT_HAZT011037 [Hyalella azteca]|uniref:Ig-like domain-containing protein n=1 Tax=Hyalella azteca TaxID=294128 RepID=A0A6A0H9M6_HYAAZ|nr:hypothetical protein HAZT_HAZT011037 [Hyalella azteca]
MYKFLVLWFTGHLTTPVYSYDGRPGSTTSGSRSQKGSVTGSHWLDASVLSDRAGLILTDTTARLSISSVKLTDAGFYKCRVDFRRQATKTTRMALEVIGKSTSTGRFYLYGWVSLNGCVNHRRESQLTTVGGASREGSAGVGEAVEPPRAVSVTEGARQGVTGVLGPYSIGSVTTVTCTASNGLPSPKVIWYYNDVLLDDQMDEIIEEDEEGPLAARDLQLTQNIPTKHRGNTLTNRNMDNIQGENTLSEPNMDNKQVTGDFPARQMDVGDGGGAKPTKDLGDEHKDGIEFPVSVSTKFKNDKNTINKFIGGYPQNAKVSAMFEKRTPQTLAASSASEDDTRSPSYSHLKSDDGIPPTINRYGDGEYDPEMMSDSYEELISTFHHTELDDDYYDDESKGEDKGFRYGGHTFAPGVDFGAHMFMLDQKQLSQKTIPSINAENHETQTSETMKAPREKQHHGFKVPDDEDHFAVGHKRPKIGHKTAAEIGIFRNTVKLGPFSRADLKSVLRCEAFNSNLTAPVTASFVIDMNRTYRYW